MLPCAHTTVFGTRLRSGVSSSPVAVIVAPAGSVVRYSTRTAVARVASSGGSVTGTADTTSPGARAAAVAGAAPIAIVTMPVTRMANILRTLSLPSTAPVLRRSCKSGAAGPIPTPCATRAQSGPFG